MMLTGTPLSIKLFIYRSTHHSGYRSNTFLAFKEEINRDELF